MVRYVLLAEHDLILCDDLDSIVLDWRVFKKVLRYPSYAQGLSGVVTCVEQRRCWATVRSRLFVYMSYSCSGWLSERHLVGTFRQ